MITSIPSTQPPATPPSTAPPRLVYSTSSDGKTNTIWMTIPGDDRGGIVVGQVGTPIVPTPIVEPFYNTPNTTDLPIGKVTSNLDDQYVLLPYDGEVTLSNS